MAKATAGMTSSITRRWLRGGLLITMVLLVLAETLFLYSTYDNLYGSVRGTAQLACGEPVKELFLDHVEGHARLQFRYKIGALRLAEYLFVYIGLRVEVSDMRAYRVQRADPHRVLLLALAVAPE